MSTPNYQEKAAKIKSNRSPNIDEALGPIETYDGRPITGHDKLVMKSLLESYLKTKEQPGSKD